MLPGLAPSVARAAGPEVLEEEEDFVTVRVDPDCGLEPDCVEVSTTVEGPAVAEGPASEFTTELVTTTTGAEGVLAAALDSGTEADCETVNMGCDEVDIATGLVGKPVSETEREIGVLEPGGNEEEGT